MAVTRARRQLVVVCDCRTVRNHEFLKSLIDYMTDHGEVRTAFEYLENVVPENYSQDLNDEHNGAKGPTGTKPKSRNQQSKKVESKHTKDVENKNKLGFRQKSGTSHITPPITSDVSKLEADDGTETEIKKEEMKQQLHHFMADRSRTELKFPPSLNSHERLLVHQLSEGLGLGHLSLGAGRQRHITVFKSVSKSEAGREKPAAEKPEVSEDQNAVKQPEEEPSKQAQQPQLDLKGLHLERMRREKEKREEKIKCKRIDGDLKDNKGQSTKRNKGEIIHSNSQ